MGVGYDSGWVGAAEGDDLDRRLAEEAEEAFDLAKPHVMTALGPIAPDELGPTLFGEGIVRPPPGGGAGPDDDPFAALAALEDFFNAGGRTIVEAGAIEGGRRVEETRWVAARAPVHVVLATGLGAGGRDAAALADGGRGAAEALAEAMVRELTERGDAMRSPTGIIAADVEVPEDEVGSLALWAASEAQRTTGAPLLLRSHDGRAHAALALLDTVQIEPARVIVSGLDWVVDEELAWAALAEGASFLLGLSGDPRGATDAGLVVRLVEAGYGTRLLLSAGCEPDPAGAMERLPLRLMAAGLAAPAVRLLLIDNPARALTIAKGEA